MPLVPLTRTAAVIGAHVPVWKIAYEFGDNTRLQMRGDRTVIVGRSMKGAVLSSIYLDINARILAQALALDQSPIGLSEGEIELARETQFSPLGENRAREYYCFRAVIEPV